MSAVPVDGAGPGERLERFSFARRHSGHVPPQPQVRACCTAESGATGIDENDQPATLPPPATVSATRCASRSSGSWGLDTCRADGVCVRAS
jgi:hypothetical protein